jgi:hypothetical protein
MTGWKARPEPRETEADLLEEEIAEVCGILDVATGRTSSTPGFLCPN